MAVEPPNVDLYELLGAAPNANTDAINAAYRRTAKQFHPDATGTPASTRLMVGLNVAREWLVNPDLRARYDRERAFLWLRQPRHEPPRPSRPASQRQTWNQQSDMREWTGLGTMPATRIIRQWDPFPGSNTCPVCRPPNAGHCALGHVGGFRPRFRECGYRDALDIVPARHFWGRPYSNPEERRRHAETCPWAAGTGQHVYFFDKPNWGLPDDYKARNRVLKLDQDLVQFLAPVATEKAVREAFGASTAGCVVLAVEEGNWIASIFAGRWAYDVRVGRDANGRPVKATCNCFYTGEGVCGHALATWIVWAAGAVRPRPPR
jgi:hypothetical protein